MFWSGLWRDCVIILSKTYAYIYLNSYNLIIEKIKKGKKKMKMKKIWKLYEKKEKEILKRVRKKNAFGRTETQIDFCEGEIIINEHLTPCITDVAGSDLRVFIRHDPFLSYDDIREVINEKILMQKK